MEASVNQGEGTPAGAGSRPDAARDAALAAIAAHAAKFPRMDLAPLDSSQLSPRDAAFAHAITSAVLARWITLRHLIQARLSQPFEALEPAVRSALLCGSAQAYLLDRVPAHAAINHAVGWAKRKVRAGAGGLVNAVLRRVCEMRADAPDPTDVSPMPTPSTPPVAARTPYTGERDQFPLADGTAILLREPVFPEDPVERLAVATGHPRTQLDAWRAAHGEQSVRHLCMHSLIDPPIIVRWPAGAALPATLTPHARPGFAVFQGSHEELLSLLATRADAWVQDPAAAGAIESVADLQPAIIIDACAGQGTKTRQLAATFPSAQIVATDSDSRRLETLRAVFGRHGGSERVKVIKPERLIDFAGKADLVLLDVPCSNSGVYARRTEAKYRFNRASVTELQGIQRQILADSIRLLSPRAGGRSGAILYSTCSLEPMENTSHIAWASEWHKLRPSRQRLVLPTGGPGKPAREYTDGAFSVVLAREEV